MRTKLRNWNNALTLTFSNYRVELGNVILVCRIKGCSKPKNEKLDQIYCFNANGFTIEVKNSLIKFTLPHTVEVHTVSSYTERQAEKAKIPISIIFGVTRPGIAPESTVSTADALFKPPLTSWRMILLYSHSVKNDSKLKPFSSIIAGTCISNITLICSRPSFQIVSIL